MTIDQMLSAVGPYPSLEQIWLLMDQAWQE